MHPDLMGPAGFQVKPDERCRWKTAENPPNGLGGAGVSAIDGHFFSIHRVPPDGSVNHAGIAGDGTVNQGQVFLIDGACFKQTGNFLMGPVI
jgi:hypothetical protein